MLDGAFLPNDASFKDFQQGRARYVANTVEQALLLPIDMVNLRLMRKHEMFLNLKRDLALVSPLTNFLMFKITTLFSPSFFILFIYFYYYYTSFLGRLFKPHTRPRRW